MKLFTRNFYQDYSRVDNGNFADDRSEMYLNLGLGKDGKHEGIDFSHNNFKYFDIKNLFDGILEFKGDNGNYGNCVKIRTNPQFAGGINDSFFTMYCHLAEVERKLHNEFYTNGTYLGKMGNTGNSKGVHLHLMTYQKNIKNKLVTPLLDDILTELNLTLNDKIAFWQWDNLYFNPEIMMKYFLKVQGDI